MARPYRTSEVRWFISSSMPAAVTNWFDEALPRTEHDSALIREDLYLPVPGRDNVGLKFRKDKIQLKLRGDQRPFSVLEGRVAGVESDWDRYSWAYDISACDMVRAFSAPTGEGRRVPVVKKRRKKTYDLGSEGDPHPLALSGRATALVLIEITEIAFAGFSGWSLGLELVGPEADTRGRLPQAVAGLLQNFPALPLKQSDCMDYPALINLSYAPSAGE